MKAHRSHFTSQRPSERHDGHTHRHEREDDTEETTIRRRPIEVELALQRPVDEADGYDTHRYDTIEHEYVGWALYPSDDPRAFDGEHAPYAAWGSPNDERHLDDEGAPAWGASVMPLDPRRRR